MKAITKLIYSAVAVVTLAIGALTANADPGDIFVSDVGNEVIYKFAPDGTRSTFASGLFTPEGLAFDSAGNLFEADLFQRSHLQIYSQWDAEHLR